MKIARNILIQEKSLMYKISVIIYLLIIAFPVTAKVYYISSEGNDLTGNGSISMPWKSLSKACSRVITPGDTIYVKAGYYNETKTSRLAVGVSLTGEGNNSIITSTSLKAEWNPIIDMRSSLLVNGNQTISYLKFDGELTAAMALDIRKRNNVRIHHCTFLDLFFTAVYWVGNGGRAGGDPYASAYPPINYVTGSEFHDNTVNNCSVYTYFGSGALYIGGHEGMLIFNNTITQTSRANGRNGYCIKIFGNGGWMRGMKIYNNIITVSGNEWLFAIEGFFCMGSEIYNNTITGAIDINFTWKDTYDYGLWIHNNTLGPVSSSSNGYTGIILEFRVEDNIIERNYFRNCAVGIHHTMRYPYPWVHREKIRYNKFYNSGNGSYHSAIRFGETSYDFDIDSLEIYNNIFHTESDAGAYFGLHIRGFRTASNVKIQNNIFLNFSWSWFDSNRGNYITNLYVQNNILYKNANSNSAILNGTPTNYINTGNIIANPNFYSESNFHPKSNSPVIDAGIYIPGIIYDLEDKQVDNPPNIGCYERIEISH